MPRLLNVAQKYFEHDHVRGNGAENFDCILCYYIFSSNVIVSAADMFTRFKKIQCVLKYTDFHCLWITSVVVVATSRQKSVQTQRGATEII